MECALHGIENKIEDENQVYLPETIDSLTTFSNLNKKLKTGEMENIYKKKNMRFWKNLENS